MHGAFDGDVCFMRRTAAPCGARTGAWAWGLGPLMAARCGFWKTSPRPAAQQQRPGETEHDALTQLFNRAAFDERLGALLAERATRLRDDGAAPHAAAAGEAWCCSWTWTISPW